jgi:hypothetical protein
MIAFLTARPYVGFLASGAGALSALLTWMKILTPILGFAGAVFGAVAGFLTLLIKWREWRNPK